MVHGPATPGDREGPRSAVRGNIPFTNQLENLERAYLSAVAAAAGCTFGEFNYDDGIDVFLKHRHPNHASVGSVDAFLQVQLKCTSQVGPNPPSGQVSRPFSNERFELYAEANPSIKKIVVTMIAPSDPGAWIRCSHDAMQLRHCCYWVNIAGRSPTGERDTIVVAPTSQVFDDVALCDIMCRIGQGGAP